MSIDDKSQEIAHLASNNQDISEITLKFINEIYQSVKSDSNFHNNHFNSAYHLATTPFVEFFIARIFYHYSEEKQLNWNINLRCQENKTVPDIRIFHKENDEKKTIAIIEIKVKVSWMQALFSEHRAIADENRRRERNSQKDSIVDFQEQIKKYLETYQITDKQFFVFIPSLNGAYKPKSNENIENYKKWFYSVTHLKEENLILLSNNPRLNLEDKNIEDIQATSNFEFLLKSLDNMDSNL
jgi:hypothetical protein